MARKRTAEKTVARPAAKIAKPLKEDTKEAQLKERLVAGERVKLRILVPGADKTPWELLYFEYYGADTYAAVIPYHANAPEHKGVQCIYTALLSDVRLFSESSPLS